MNGINRKGGWTMLFVIQKEDGRNYNDVEFVMLTELIHTYRE